MSKRWAVKDGETVVATYDTKLEADQAAPGYTLEAPSVAEIEAEPPKRASEPEPE